MQGPGGGEPATSELVPLPFVSVSPAGGREPPPTRGASCAPPPPLAGSKPLHSEKTAGSPTAWDHLPFFLRSEA